MKSMYGRGIYQLLLIAVLQVLRQTERLRDAPVSSMPTSFERVRAGMIFTRG